MEPTLVIKEQGQSITFQASNVRDAQHVLRLLVMAMAGTLDQQDRERVVQAPAGILQQLRK